MNLLSFISSGQGRIYNPDSNGNYNPATATNSLLDKWKTFTFGLFPHWGLATFSGSEVYASNANSAVANPSIFLPPSNINTKIEGWVDYCKDTLEADYITFVVKHNYGFTLWPTSVEFNGGVDVSSYDETRATNILRPQYKPYGVNHSSIIGSASQTMVETFVNRCRQKNIEPVLYYNLGKSLNIDWAHTRPTAAFDDTGNYVDYYDDWYANGYASANAAYPTLTGTYGAQFQKQIDFQKAQLLELINLTDCQYYWMDSPYTYPKAHLQDTFNAVKAPRDIIIIWNNFNFNEGGRTMYPTGNIPNEPPYDFVGDLWLFPVDVPAVEYVFRPDSAGEIGNFTRPWKGLNYHMPSEVAMLSGSTWFWKSGFTAHTISTLQGYYDYANNQSVPCSLALSPDQNGDIPADQKTALEGIVR